MILPTLLNSFSLSRMKNRSILFFLIVVLFTGCIPVRAIFYGAPDKKDILRFPHSEIQASGNCFEFYKVESHVAEKIKVNEWGSGSPYFLPLDELCKAHSVRSFVIIRNDTLLYEYYRKDLNASSLHASYSVAKSFTSALIGIAIKDGFIKSERDNVVNYIPELKDVEGADDLLIEHLLNMTSGIKYNLNTDAVIYYGSNTKKALKHIEFESKPGTRQEYLNINIHLLGLILHRTTGKTPAEYMSEKLWKPLGMCTDAIWTKDRKGENLTFCCMGAAALDYAKFGRLYLNKGIWKGEQIIPTEWYDKSIERDTTEGSSFGYNYCWHIGEKEYGDFMADGMYKQHIYIYPKKNIIIVLMADKENLLKAERTRWRNVFQQIADQL